MKGLLFERCRHVALATIVLTSGVGCRPTVAELPADLGRSDDALYQGRIVLGSPSLTAGIPGEGSLTLAAIRRWLAEPSNHAPLEVALPLGLRGNSDTPPKLPEDNPLTRAKIELGRQLFFDRRLSAGEFLACGDCHHPKAQFSGDELNNPQLRETAVVFNRIGTHAQFWDGRAKSLEDQVRFPLENAAEMNTTPADAARRIAAIEGYRMQFTAVFGEVSFDNIASALAAFQRALVTGPSTWDYDQQVQRLSAKPADKRTRNEEQMLAASRAVLEKAPLSNSARRGAALFFSERTHCSRCHNGPNFTDEAFHDIGLRPTPYRQRQGGEFANDTGRHRVTSNEADRFAFKTPTLRNTAQSHPYLHDGRYTSLAEVIDYFCRGGDGQPNELAPVDLTRDEKRDLAAFLESLTGSLPAVETGRLPP